MKKLFLIILIVPFLFACSTVAPQMIKIDEEYHKAILDIATTRMKYVSCDVGLINGLGIASVIDFPIYTSGEARAILSNPAISLALSEMKEITVAQGQWKEDDYAKCKIEGLGYRAAALGTIDILKLFPQLAPYLAIFGK